MLSRERLFSFFSSNPFFNTCVTEAKASPLDVKHVLCAQNEITVLALIIIYGLTFISSTIIPSSSSLRLSTLRKPSVFINNFILFY
jgi:hypothetical protein